MKLKILILTVLLSCVFGDRNAAIGNIQDIAGYVVVEQGLDRTEDESTDCRSAGILPARTAGFSGENNSVVPSVRSANSGRRVQSSGKTSFRVIKAGKVIDRYTFNTFRTELKQFPSGINSIYRYIHSLCQLLI